MQTAIALAVSLVVLAPVSSAADPLSAGDRQRLVAHLEMTEAWLASELEGLSDAQLNFHMTPDSWSITEVATHLAIAEPQYWQQLQESLKKPAVDGYKPEATDAGILWYGIDRTNRQKTGEARVPHGQFATAKDALASFRKLRATMLEVARGSQDDMRNRPLLDGNMSVYQWFLMISTHSQRHILQIRELKARGEYPKK